MYFISLPIPPSINNYYGHHCKSRTASIYIKPKGKQYRKQTKDYIRKNNLDIHANIPLELNIIFTPLTKHRQDIDNIQKCLFDALTHSKVYEDDSLIYKLTIEKRPPSKENAGIILEIKKYTIKD